MTRGRTLLLYGFINDSFSQKLAAYANSRRGKLRIILHSVGGHVPYALSCVDWLQRHPNTTIIGTGVVMSAALPILAAGTRRLATPSTRFMVHQVRVELPDPLTRQDLKIEARETLILEKAYFRALAEGTGQSISYWENLARGGEHYFGVDEALEHGLIDEVLR